MLCSMIANYQRAVRDFVCERADSDNSIKKLQYDFSLNDFVAHYFWTTEICGNFIIMTCNFLLLFQHTLVNSDKNKFLKTVRYEFISIPAIFRKDERQTHPVFGKIAKNQASLSVDMGNL